jgi:hypothetical protein
LDFRALAAQREGLKPASRGEPLMGALEYAKERPTKAEIDRLAIQISEFGAAFSALGHPPSPP